LLFGAFDDAGTGLFLRRNGEAKKCSLDADVSYIFMSLIGVQWVINGYSLAFGPDIGGLIGGLDYLGFTGVGAQPNAVYAKNIPHQLFAAFQMMFAVITPALITGAFVERVKFKSFLLFSLLWATLVYDPLCHWVWGQSGWLKEMGVLDFAGGTVVHIAAGFSALAFALVIGPRKGYGSFPIEPNNIPLTVLGTGLVWVGWFGFNAGSALGANGVAVNALVTTNTSAATAGLVWMLLSWLDGRPSTLGIATGMVVGLAAVTPACGYVTPWAAMVIGAVAAPLAYYAIRFRERRKLDESLDVGRVTEWPAPGDPGHGVVRDRGRQRRCVQRIVFRQSSQFAVQLIASSSRLFLPSA
jgi:Amt family ammonium transporter